MTYNEIIEFVRTIVPLGKWAILMTIVMLLRKRPEPGSILDVLTEHFEFVLARHRARKAGHGKAKAYELAVKDVATAREVRRKSAAVVPIKKSLLPSRRARDPAEDPPA